MRAPSDLRSAAAAVANAKTPEEREAAQREYNKMIEQYQRLPDDDPRKADAKEFIIHLANQRTKQEATQDITAARTISDAAKVSAAADSGNHARKMMGSEDRAARGKSEAVAATQMVDDFGATPQANQSGRSPPVRRPQAGV